MSSDNLGPFQELQKLSCELEHNLRLLEFELSDATKILNHCENDPTTEAKGIQILKDVLQQNKNICEELEKIVEQDETKINKLNEELQAFKEIYNTKEKEQEELEQYLVNQNVIQLSLSEASLLDEPNSEEQLNGNIVSPQPSSSCNSTFQIPSVPKLPNRPATPEGDFQNTICDFQSAKSSLKMLRKTFVVKKTDK